MSILLPKSLEKLSWPNTKGSGGLLIMAQIQILTMKFLLKLSKVLDPCSTILSFLHFTKLKVDTTLLLLFR